MQITPEGGASRCDQGAIGCSFDVGGVAVNEVMRRLARDQWVRLHGTPRVTVLVGSHARRVYLEWLELGRLAGRLYEGADLDQDVRSACAQVTETPSDLVAIATTRAQLDQWRRGRTDRLAAMVNEGLIELAPPTPPAPSLDARSAAEAALYEALQATPATTGRFVLNESLSVRFGPVACEVDLLARNDGIAIEIDGYRHFGDFDCYRDRRKDLLLQTQGLVVIRVLAEDAVSDPRPTILQVCEALAYRQRTR